MRRPKRLVNILHDATGINDGRQRNPLQPKTRTQRRRTNARTARRGGTKQRTYPRNRPKAAEISTSSRNLSIGRRSETR
jgi:hypothetical protein